LIFLFINSVPFLFQAFMLDSQRLIAKCWEFIDTEIKNVIKRKEFLGASLEMIETMCDRDTLDVSEMDLYEALVRWSEEECHRRFLEITVENQQQVLATILPKVRFPLMAQNRFATKVVPKKLLKDNQILQMFLWYSFDKPKDKPKVDFVTKPREGMFKEHCIMVPFPENTASKMLYFTPDHDIYLEGYGLRFCDPKIKKMPTLQKDGFYRFDMIKTTLCTKHEEFILDVDGAAGFFGEYSPSESTNKVFIHNINQEIKFNFTSEFACFEVGQEMKLYFTLDKPNYSCSI
jgi:hypothetical protein